MQTRVVNIKGVDFDATNPDHVYIGRKNKNYEVAESKWANPFKVGDDGTRDEVINAYREWIKHQPELMNSLEELRGKILFCWCCPEACHGHVLVEMLEGNTELKIHPAAELFPPMTEAEFLGLKEDIQQHGQREDIVVWRGQLIDGRHRLRACRELGIEPEIAELMDETDPWQYVVSHNLHRRHLTTAQRAMVADKLASRKQGEKKADSGIPLYQPTQAEAAKLVNVSVDSVKQARKIRKTATPETVAAVERGEVSLNEAVATVKPVAAAKTATAINETRLWYVNGKPVQLPVEAKPANPPKAATATTEPEVEKKSPTVMQIQRTLMKMGADKKRHQQLLQVARDAVHRMPINLRIEYLASAITNLDPVQQRQLQQAVAEKQDALDAEAESYGE